MKHKKEKPWWKKVKLPKSWKNITLVQYVSIYDLTQEEPNPNDKYWELEQQCKILSEITGVSFDTIYSKTPVAVVKETFRKVGFIYSPPSTKPEQSFKLGGYKWKVEHNITKLPASAYIDLTEYAKEPHNLIHNAHNIMALFCTPYKYNWLKLRYEPATLKPEEYGRILQHCPVSVAYPLTVFFCNVWSGLINNTVPFLNSILQKMKEEMEEVMRTQSTTTSDADGL